MTEPSPLLNKVNDLQAQINELKNIHPAPLKSSGGGDMSDGMEARVAKLEAGIEFLRDGVTEIKTTMVGLRQDMRADFRWYISGIVGLAFLLFGAVGWASQKIEGVHDQLTTINVSIERLRGDLKTAVPATPTQKGPASDRQ